MRLPPLFLCLVLFAGSATPAAAQETYDPEARLRTLGLELPPAPTPVANYVEAVRVGDLLFVAGHGPCDVTEHVGKVGGDKTVDEGYAAARATALCILSTLKAELGDLRRVKRIVRLLGMVNATPEFRDHPRVINGASDLFAEVFGERGKHARASVGVASLPFDILVEIEIIAEIETDQP